MRSDEFNRIKEKIKSFVLVVLFLSTILLLYFFWTDADTRFGAKPQPADKIASLPLETLMLPSYFLAGTGADAFEPLDSDISKVIACLQSISVSENALIEVITKEQYEESLSFPSLKVGFNYAIPFSGFCEQFQIKKMSGSDGISTLSEIVYSTGNEGSLLIYDKKKEAYFRTLGEVKTEPFVPLKSLLSTALSDGISTSYPLWTYIGKTVGNRTLVPLTLNSTAKDFPCLSDLDLVSPEKTTVLTQEFFGNSFDFVRKIEEEKGTVIYMYGYGEKVLILNVDGSMVYKEEHDNKGASNPDFFTSLKTATGFIAEHGGFETLDGMTLTPYLQDVVQDPENLKGYRFIFSYKIDENHMYYQNSYPLIVEVSGGKVTYFFRHFITYDADAMKNTKEEAFSAINMLAQNYSDIASVLRKEGKIEARKGLTPSTFEEISKEITRIEHGYVLLSAEHPSLVKAVWVVTLDDIEFYYGLFDAKPWGYSLR